MQSYLLFCRGDVQTKPDDCNLKAFAEWQRKHGGGGRKSVAAAAPGGKSEEKEEDIGVDQIASADVAKNKKKRRR